jgi:hypothetical protein
MIYTNATASDLPSGRGSAFSSKIALVLVAAVAASAVIAWMADIDPITRKSEPAPPEATASMFDARFLLDAAPHLPAEDSPFRHLVRPLAAELQGKFQQAKETLAQKLRTVDWQIASSGESTTSTINVTAIPQIPPD